jgi:alkane 1-monooxygenase
MNDTKALTADNGRFLAIAKKYWYLLTLVPPILGVFVASYLLQTGEGLILSLPLIVFYILIPAADHLFGKDHFNPSKEQEEEYLEDSYYVNLLCLSAALYWAAIGMVTYAVCTISLPWYNLLAAMLSIGVMHAGTFTLSHELGHKMSDKKQSFFAKLAIACMGYAHFNIEHNKGHHKDVATPEDPASSRMGESLYKFARRELPGAAVRGWELEADRLKRIKKSVWSRDNEILQCLSITVIGFTTLILISGIAALPFLLITSAFGWFQLTQANYIEHYGLLRQKLESGRYERCQPKHSWNSNYRFSNLITLHLQRHSDHHAHPTRAYQVLRDYDDAPALPSGYPLCMAMSMIPPLWFAVMDQKVVRWAEGDMTLVNMDTEKRNELFQRYHDQAVTA